MGWRTFTSQCSFPGLELPFWASFDAVFAPGRPRDREQLFLVQRAAEKASLNVRQCRHQTNPPQPGPANPPTSVPKTSELILLWRNNSRRRKAGHILRVRQMQREKAETRSK